MSDTTETRPAEVDRQILADLDLTIEFLRTHEWGQGSDIAFEMVDDKLVPSFCVNGAIRAAIGGLTWDEDGTWTNRDIFGRAENAQELNERKVRVREQIAQDIPDSYQPQNIIDFNDDVDTEKQDILALLERTKARLSQGGTDA